MKLCLVSTMLVLFAIPAFCGQLRFAYHKTVVDSTAVGNPKCDHVWVYKPGMWNSCAHAGNPVWGTENGRERICKLCLRHETVIEGERMYHDLESAYDSLMARAQEQRIRRSEHP